MFGEEDIVKSHKSRADVITNIILVSFAIILARLWYLQIYMGEAYRRYSLENSLRKETVMAPRGMIFSRNNELMVHNVPRFDVIIVPQYLKTPKETVEMLAQRIEVPAAEIFQKLNRAKREQASYIPVVIKKNLSRKEVALIETENSYMPGVSVSTFITREYSDEFIGSHMLGYISKLDKQGKKKVKEYDEFQYIGVAGIEKVFDKHLKGDNGFEFVEVDALGRKRRYLKSDLLLDDIQNRPAVPGLNIRLTIDRDLQLAAYEALEGKVGSVVALDVTNGEILAIISRPSYNPSIFSRQLTSDYWSILSKDENEPLYDRAIQDHYPPGSTFKTITALAALEEGIVDENTEVRCNGYFQLGRKTFHCWKKHGHGVVNIYKAIRESCDVYFYKIGTKIDIDVLAKYAKMLGFGNKTGISLPRETRGLIPTKDWKLKKNAVPWQLGETLLTAIGQSYVLATPLQLTVAYAAIANNGRLVKPVLIKEIFSNAGDIIQQGNNEISTEKIFSDKTLKIVREGLFQVANNPTGTAWWYRGKGINMSGKTGTSQVVRFSSDKIFNKCEDNEYKLRHHAVFAAYAPSDNPKIAVGVVVEHGCHGSSAGAPVATAIISKYLEKYYPELREKYLKEDNKMLAAHWSRKKAQAAEEAKKNDEE